MGFPQKAVGTFNEEMCFEVHNQRWARSELRVGAIAGLFYFQLCLFVYIFSPKDVFVWQRKVQYSQL